MVHTTALNPKAHQLVMATLARATRRFHLTNALTAVESSSCSIPPIVLHASILQNEVLFSSEGLTLLSMDHLYTFKSALSHYATGRTEPGSEFRLEDAVDDLRRYVLSSAGGRRRLLKSVLVQAYDWLGQVNDFALSDVTEMYCRAYGGTTSDCGVEDDLVRSTPAMASIEPAAKPAAPTQFTRGDNLLSLGPEGTSILESFLKQAGEGSQSTTDVPTVSEAPVPKNEADVLADTPEPTLGRIESPHRKQLFPNYDTKNQDSITPTQPPQVVPQIPSSPTPFLKTPSPRASPKASLPALRVQTSFAQPIIKPKPRRKETLVPAPQPLHKKKSEPVRLDTTSLPLSAVARPADDNNEWEEEDNEKEDTGMISIEIHADDDPSNDEADLTDFEDADLTARPPPSATCGKTPVELIWSGIDEILGNKPSSGEKGTSSGDRRATARRGMILTPSSSLSQHRRRSSSLVLSSSQEDGNIGPATPNGYDDISPITRGEWGFLMVSDPFRTKTAGVSCV